jgi:tetratricopeptide (TPR) repeat protein/WD40 repeat protein
MVDRASSTWDSAPPRHPASVVARLRGRPLAEVVAALRADQTARWRAGDRLLVETYFANLPELAAALEDALVLIFGEVLLRLERGESPRLEEYQRRFPALAEPLAAQFDLQFALAVLPTVGPGDLPDGRDGPPTLPGYDVLGEVGRGSMGVVYKARHLALNRVVALKVILGGAHAGVERQVRFRQEAELAARLVHPNIVQVYEVGAHAGCSYLAQEYVDGGSLAQRAAGRPLPPREAARLVEVLARAAGSAHARGVVHRDLKPGNVLLTADGVPKVADFGLAKLVGLGHGLTQTGAVLGTPSYMAPEQAAGRDREVGPAADVYALGAILYELLAGRPPFTGETPLEVLRRVESEEPPSLSRVVPRPPADLATITAKCLRKEPARRYASAEALAEDLRRFQAGEAITARPVTPLERTLRWCRRNPVVAALTAAVFLLLTALMAGALVKNADLRHALSVSDDARRETERARLRADRQRWEATFEQAKANRLSRRPGQRIKTLGLLRQCAEEARALELPDERRAELRNAVLATLAMPDLDLEEVGAFAPGGRADFDGSFELYARTDAQGNGSIRRLADDVELYHIPGAGKDTSPKFSPSGRFLALTTEDATQLWERGDREWTRRLVVRGEGVWFRPDDRLMAVTEADGGIRVYDLPSAQLRGRLAPDTLGHGITIDLHPTEPLVAVGCYFGDILQVRDLRTGEVLAKRDGLAKPCDPVWHPDGRRLLASAGEQPRVDEFVWDPAARSLTWHRSFPTRGSGSTSALNRAGDRLAVVGWPSVLQLFDFETGRLLFQAPGAWRTSRPARFDTAGTRLAWAVADQGGRLGIWRVGDGREYRTLAYEPLPERSHVDCVAVDPGGRLLAAGVGRGGVVLWDLRSGRRLAVLPQAVTTGLQVTFDAAGALYTSSEAGTYRWPVRPAAGSPDRLELGPPEGLPFPPGGREFAVSRDGLLRAKVYFGGYGEQDYAGVWVQRTDVAPVPSRVEAGTGCNEVSVSPDGRWVAVAQHIGSLRIWGVKDGNRLDRVKVIPGQGAFCRFSPDNRWLWSAVDGGRLFHVGTWEPGPACPGGYAVFSPAGDLLATTLATGHVVLYDPRTGRELARLEDPSLDESGPPVFGPDGAQLITLTRGNVKGVHVWDLRRLRRILREMDLDWDLPDYPPEEEQRPLQGAAFLRPELARLPAQGEALWQAADRRHGAQEIALYSTALALQPLNPEAYYRRGLAQFRLRQTKEALTDFDHAATLRPDHAETYHWRAHAHERLGQWPDAEADFSAALALRPDDAHLLDCRGRCRLRLGRFHEGVADLEHSLAVKPGQPALARFLARECNNRAWHLVTGAVAERDPEQALALARKAEKWEPGNPLYVNTLGVAQYRCGRFEDAVGTLERGLAARKGEFNGFDLYFLAMAHARLGERVAARARFDRAVKWQDARKDLSPEHLGELKAFRAEAEAVLQAK